MMSGSKNNVVEQKILDTMPITLEPAKIFYPDILENLISRQKSLKLFMCVVFGYTGATTSGKMPLREFTDSIVSTAKYIMNQVIEFINSNQKWDAKVSKKRNLQYYKKNQQKVIYGDTDSVFVNLKGRSMQEAVKIGKEISKEYTGNYIENEDDPIKFESKGMIGFII
ncbi:hypothetical protein IMG5_124940 [Ichthyophthirius multifiliis]|uniref:DNA-directed DNA polymerase n=1 Tax=Ichthyophthirius multifiliis TaxID=5932 RepID=G0QVP0_ICHMU|nr:hypothetical protein IMG5_124940 [Ichthyophthirius multifiliis]EGR30727.1 hypothetical protein IMG5_124940 [Ichthyophthirius multifiliis]|eukprot:XP_004032314.1 hypothetical protein IMG5_124940 [Ichthyophthirius multifiliis]